LADYITSFIRNFRKIYKVVILFVFLLSFGILQSYPSYGPADWNVTVIPFILIGLSRSASNNNGKDRVGIIYARVSSKAQAEEGESLPSQIEVMTEIAKKDNIRLPFEPIADDVSGKNFRRRGNLERILKLAEENKITHLLSLDIHRIGRNPIENLYYIHRLRELGVKIRTKDEELDIHKITDLIITMIKSLAALMEVNALVERTQRGKIQKWKNKNWIKPVPLGYEKDDSWIGKDLQKASLIKDIWTFRGGESYGGFCRMINKKYSPLLDSPLKPSQLKRMLRDPVYVGKPKYAGVTVDAPELAFVDQATFDEVQRALEKKSRRRNYEDKKFVEAKDLVNMFGVHYAERVLGDEIAWICCGKPMVKNGPKKVGNVWVHNYLCQECKAQKPRPLARQLSHFNSVKLLYCPHCGTPDDFTVEATGDLNKFTCQVCGESFKCDEPGNKFLRYIRKRQREKEGKDYTPIVLLRDRQITLVDFGLEAG